MKDRYDITMTDEDGDAIAFYDDMTIKEARALANLKAMENKPEIIECYAYLGSFQDDSRQEDAEPEINE